MLASLALTACVAQPGLSGQSAVAPPQPSQLLPLPGAPANTGTRIAILLPLSGPNAEVGQALLRAAQLALATPGRNNPPPALDQYDTRGTPDGAAEAARAALAAEAGIILGPLTTAETAVVAPIARASNTPVLAFTSDSSRAAPGVWPLGITPSQQMRRLVVAMQAENKTRIAAVLPTNLFGDALANGLAAATRDAAMPDPRILRTQSNFASLNNTLKAAADYDRRRGAIEAQQSAARASADPATRAQSPAIGAQDVPPPPMDALFLGETGELLGQAVPLLGFYDIGPAQLRVLGPATWAREAGRQPGLAGAWYAAPDPALRLGFEQAYTARYNAAARDFTSIAFDAAAIARTAATPAGFPIQSIIRPDGYAGADGLLALMPDGQVRRGLAIFEIDRGGAHIVQPAPQSVNAPGV